MLELILGIVGAAAVGAIVAHLASTTRAAVTCHATRSAAETFGEQQRADHALPPLPAGRYPGLQLAPLSVLAEPCEVVTSLLATA
jgi:hypothetical protein